MSKNPFKKGIISAAELGKRHEVDLKQRYEAGEFDECTLCETKFDTPWNGEERHLCSTCAEKVKRWNWEDICEVERDLRYILKAACAIKDNRKEKAFCANQIWYALFKPRIKMLVGYEARNPVLRSSHCYDLVYEKIYADLPDCRNCQCVHV